MRLKLAVLKGLTRKVEVTVRGRHGTRWVRELDRRVIRMRRSDRVPVFASERQSCPVERCLARHISLCNLG